MKKPLVMAIMLVFMAIYAIAAATLGGMLVDAPRLVQLCYYVVAGVVWVFPLKPLIDWMNRGS